MLFRSGYFAVDEKTVDYYRVTGRDPALVDVIEGYYRAQGLFGIPGKGTCDYTQVIELDLSKVVPSVSGPRRPQERIDLSGIRQRFTELFSQDVKAGGYGKPAAALDQRVPIAGPAASAGHGDVLIAAITSCTNTSNPNLLLAAGLLAKKAVEKGLTVDARVKT